MGAWRLHSVAKAPAATLPATLVFAPQVLKANQRAKEASEGVRRYSKGVLIKVLQGFLSSRCPRFVVSTMDSAREPTQGSLDAAGFWQVWQRFDVEGE